MERLDSGQPSGHFKRSMSNFREIYDHPAALEPFFPSGSSKGLREQAADLARRSSALGGMLHPATQRGVAALLRGMNSYYSNLIEGHNTHPVAIERALKNDYSSDSNLRALQLESKAHIEVQMLIEARLISEPSLDVCSSEFLCWIHHELFERMPDEFRVLKTRSGAEDRVAPGQLRQCEVEVGRHIAPASASLPRFLTRFSEAYSPTHLDPLDRIIAAAASHHRLAWIHPFLDGNGRVTRLFTDAFLAKADMGGHGLWTMSRGLSRHRERYLSALAAADQPRRNDLDGRGNLSNGALRDFCSFFLGIGIDQVKYMGQLLDLDAMQERILLVGERLLAEKKVSKETPRFLCDLFLRGEVSRGEAAWALRRPERSARRILANLLDMGLLVSDKPGDAVRIGFPATLVGYYFPRLYPEGVEIEAHRNREEAKRASL